MQNSRALQEFLQQHQLPQQFLQLVEAWYAPLAAQLAQHHAGANRPLLIGVNGSQGSGKSTLASLLALLLREVYGLKVIDLSIDDFYLTHQSRLDLSQTIHPLLATRGVPGTHDLKLMDETLRQLTQSTSEIAIPRFDKSTDDRYPESHWQQISAPLDLVILEGWCLGVPAQPPEALLQPVNELEASEDPDAIWRNYINRQIETHYSRIYQTMDLWIMLQAPSFDCVYQWRLEQEEKLALRLQSQDNTSVSSSRVMSAEQISRFIQHFQRLTQHALSSLPDKVHYLFKLDEQRNIIAAKQPQKAQFK